MHHIHAEQQRHAEAGLLHSHPLQRADLGGAGDMKERADLAAPHPLQGRRVQARVQGALAPARRLVQLADLLVQGHALEQVAHARGSRLDRLADGDARTGQE